VITSGPFTVEPWTVRETELDLARLAQSESLFALSNGHIGMRGNLDEGEPAGLPGTYLAGLYEVRPLPYPEGAFGYPEAGQAVINVTNGKIIRLLVEDEPFDLRYGQLLSHERVLDMRDGVLRRSVEWRSPSGALVRVRSTRLVSFKQRAVAAIRYEVEAVEKPVSVVVQSELVVNETLPDGEVDPRVEKALQGPLAARFGSARERRAVLAHSTKASKLTLAAAMDHVLADDAHAATEVEAFEDLARLLVTADVEPGRPLRLDKLLAYGWSARRSPPAIIDQVSAALAGARRVGWDGLLSEQREYLEAFWDRADVVVGGDAELQQAVRFGMFHSLQAAARGEHRAIAAKGLTGSGYDGHAFWDTEVFVLPLLTYVAPQAAGDALRWRHRTLPIARARARALGLEGASFAWRTIHGEECSGYWPAGTAAFHVNAAVADAVIRYQAATGDEAFAAGMGLELLVETARLWRSLGHHDAKGRFRIDGVTGPDEYSAIADNNLYTNLMAERNLREAFQAVQRHGRRAAELGVDEEEASSWRDAARAMVVPYDGSLGVHEQAEGFTSHERWDFEATGTDDYPLLLHYPYFDLYRKQVVKQADLVLALHLRGDAFTLEQKQRDFAYYEELTVRDSSLSACTQATLAAETGHLELAHDYLREAALIDLDDLQHNTRDGVHIASLAGAWIGVVAGLGGMRDHDGKLSFRPALPDAITDVSFRLCYGGRRLLVEVTHEQARYTLRDGDPLEIEHYEQALTLTGAGAESRPIPARAEGEPPRQPPGRSPLRRRPERRAADEGPAAGASP
jgi:alpha,alpha-trehalose phosphorylase